MRTFRSLKWVLAAAGLGGFLVVSGCDEFVNPNVFLFCPPIDLVFLMDTSGSMDDEAQALCTKSAQVKADIEARGAELTTTFLGITEDADDEPLFSCLEDNARDLLGAAVPQSGGDELDDTEDWAPGTSVVAARFPWHAQALRIIVPISDEGPQDGDPCDGQENVDAVNNAIQVAKANNVIVSPIAGTDSSQCVIDFMQQLASATGGEANVSTDPNLDLGGFIFSLVESACRTTGVSATP